MKDLCYLRRGGTVASIFILLIGLLILPNVALAAEPKSAIRHVFENIFEDTYSDLHIEYEKNIANTKPPVIGVKGGAILTRWSIGKKENTLDIYGSFPPNSQVEVWAHSALKGVLVSRYWWTPQVEPKIVIPVKYYEKEAGRRGKFTHSTTIKKLEKDVQVTVTGAVNIVGGKAQVQKDHKTAQISGLPNPKTKITFTGKLRDENKKGIVTAIIDPPDEVFDYVLHISPRVRVPVFPNWYTMMAAVAAAGGLGYLIWRRWPKRA